MNPVLERIQALLERQEQLNSELEYIQVLINEFPDQSSEELEALFSESLNEIYDIPFGLTASRVLKECDPIQYDQAYSDWLDSFDLNTLDDYTDLTREVERIEERLEEINEALQAIEDLIEDALDHM